MEDALNVQWLVTHLAVSLHFVRLHIQDALKLSAYFRYVYVLFHGLCEVSE